MTTCRSRARRRRGSALLGSRIGASSSRRSRLPAAASRGSAHRRSVASRASRETPRDLGRDRARSGSTRAGPRRGARSRSRRTRERGRCVPAPRTGRVVLDPTRCPGRGSRRWPTRRKARRRGPATRRTAPRSPNRPAARDRRGRRSAPTATAGLRDRQGPRRARARPGNRARRSRPQGCVRPRSGSVRGGTPQVRPRADGALQAVAARHPTSAESRGCGRSRDR
jgi:hypothetical protein